VDTYTSFGWFGKPLALSPLHCARFGWKLRAPDTLVCTQCKRQLIFQNAEPTQLIPFTQLFLGLLQSTHLEDCPFRSQSVPAALYAIRSKPSTALVHGFYERFYALSHALDSIAKGRSTATLRGGSTASELIPSVETKQVVDTAVRTLQHSTLYMAAASHIPRASCVFEFREPPSDPHLVPIFASFMTQASSGVDVCVICEAIAPEQPLHRTLPLLCLSLCGWVPRASKPGNSSSNVMSTGFLVKCLYCRRRQIASLTALTPSPSSSSSSSDDVDFAPAAKKSKLDEITTCDPISDHKNYCPWVSTVEHEKHLAWQICFRALILSISPSGGHSTSETSSSLDVMTGSTSTSSSDAVQESEASLLDRLSRTLHRVQALAKQPESV